MTNTAIRSIIELKGNKFIVEDYQRGYKWTHTEVGLLLNDIFNFNGSGFYCLQPVVVRKVRDDAGEAIELIDGQQRLTTIYILLSYLLPADERLFSLKYKTRKSSEVFLENINKLKNEDSWKSYLGKPGNREHDNIDNFHFFEAYGTIRTWVSDKSKEDITSFIHKLTCLVKVIWYEVPPALSKDFKAESIKIFTRINGGKILLTNAELIKALFLINVENDGKSDIHILKQNEIAQQWDNIEYALQDNDFWYFLANKNPSPTRIDLIFDLLANKKDETQDKLYTFLEYNRAFGEEPDKSKWVDEEWERVKNLFSSLQEWYEDRRLYHFIGYLIWRKIPLKKIVGWKNESEMTKLEFLRKIEDEAKIKLEGGKTLQTIGYGNSNIESILLLHNILTLLKNDSSNDFSFAKYKTEDWDIEHIHARESKNITDKKDWISWKNETADALKKVILSKEFDEPRKALLRRFDDVIDERLTKEIFDQLFADVIDFYKSLDDNPEELNALSNLALLDAGTNRSYQNAIFSVKRDKIIAQDKKGVFIPICTKNVFLKYYSSDLSQMFLWKFTDKKAYFKDIEKTVKPYMLYS